MLFRHRTRDKAAHVSGLEHGTQPSQESCPGKLYIELSTVIRQEPDREELRVRQVRKLAVDEDDSLLRARCGAGIMGVSVYVHTFVYRTGPMASR